MSGALLYCALSGILSCSAAMAANTLNDDPVCSGACAKSYPVPSAPP